jgi:hypothetical protein
MALNLAYRRVRGKPVRELEDEIVSLDASLGAGSAETDAERVMFAELTEMLVSLDVREAEERMVEVKLLSGLQGAFKRGYERGFNRERLGGGVLRRLALRFLPTLFGTPPVPVRAIDDGPSSTEQAA